MDWILFHWWDCLYLFSFHVLIYCIYTSLDFNKWCPKPSCRLGQGSTLSEHLPAEEPHVQNQATASRLLLERNDAACQCILRWTFFPGGVQLHSSVTFQKAFSGATAAISRRSWSAAWHTRLRCGPTSSEQQKHGIQDSPESAGDRCNTIPGKPISANRKAKKQSYLNTPVLGRAWCILHVISIFGFDKLELFCIQTLNFEQRKAYSYEKESKCIKFLKINFIAKLYL